MKIENIMWNNIFNKVNFKLGLQYSINEFLLMNIIPTIEIPIKIIEINSWNDKILKNNLSPNKPNPINNKLKMWYAIPLFISKVNPAKTDTTL